MRVVCRSIDRLPPGHKRGHVYDSCHFHGEAARDLLAGDIHGIELESCTIEGVDTWKASRKSGETYLHWERYSYRLEQQIYGVMSNGDIYLGEMQRVTDNERKVIEVTEKILQSEGGTIVVNGVRQPLRVVTK